MKKDNQPVQKYIIVKLIQRYGLSNYISASDFSLFFIKPSYSKIASSPTKLGELLARGIPVICNNKAGKVEAMIDQTHSGFRIGDFSDKTFQETISEMDSLKIDSNSIREKAKIIFDLNFGVDAYWKIYSNILKKNENSPDGNGKTASE